MFDFHNRTNIFLISYILLLFHLAKGSWNKLTKYEKIGKYLSYCTVQGTKFSIKDFLSKSDHLVTFTEEILNGKLPFLSSVALGTVWWLMRTVIYFHLEKSNDRALKFQMNNFSTPLNSLLICILAENSANRALRLNRKYSVNRAWRIIDC